MSMGGNSTAGVTESSSTGSLVVGPGGGTSDQSSVTAPTNRPSSQHTGLASSANSSIKGRRGDVRSHVAECVTWSANPSGHSAEPAGDTSTVQTLPGHHCGKSRETLYHVLQTYTATS